MAVPFSRPAYPGGSRRRSQQQRAQQTQQPQTTSQRQITRFLDGQGGIRLDQLSLTSRIAFYALYEAYRLLMDLTQQSQQSNGTQQPQQQQSQQSQQHTVLNGNVPEERRPAAPQVYHPLPDIVESTRSYPRDFVGINDNDKCQSVQPDIVQDTFDNTNDSNQDETDRAYQVPDVISRIGNNSPNADQYQHHRDFVFKTTSSNYHFKSQRSVSVSSDYFSLDGLSTVDEEEASDDDFDKFDDNSKDQDLDLDKDLVQKGGPNGINWQNLGKQLCEIASAFEVTYAPPVNEHHRELYEVYRDLKLKTLTLSRTDTSVTGLAKTVLRQVLLSSIWILIKKIT